MAAYWKDIFRQIRTTMGRFLSILIISALGVGSFAGLRSVSPDMRLTADLYYDDTLLMDVRVLSTLGFSEEDMLAIQGTGMQVQGTHILDAMISRQGDNTEHTIKFYCVGDGEEMNRPQLLEGRLPQAADECALSRASMEAMGIGLGDVVRLSSGKKDPITDTLYGDTYTVTGVVQSSMYVSSRDYGGSPVGDGSLSGYGFLSMEAFDLDVYTAVLLRVPGAEECMSGEAEYVALMDQAVEELEAIAAIREPARYAEIMDEANEKLADAEQELADGEKEREEKLYDARQTIDDAKQKLADAEVELEDGKRKLEREIAKGRRELRDAEQEIADGEKEIIENQQKLEDAQREIDDGWREVEDGKAELEEARVKLEDADRELENAFRTLYDGQTQQQAGWAELEQAAQMIAGMEADPTTDPLVLAYAKQQYAEGLAKYHAGGAAINDGWTEYHEGKKEYEEGLEEYEKGLADLEEATYDLQQAQQEVIDGHQEIADAIVDIEQAKVDVAQGYRDLEKGEREGRQEIEEAEQKIADAKVELADGEREYEEQEAESAQKIADAHKEIADAREDLADLEEPTWYIFTREDNPAYSEYLADTDRINAIAAVFPAVFFGVAILISLTTMNRMVDEQRGFIGTMKLLGYSQTAIAMKYLIYAFIPCGLGSVLGVLLLGQYFFPLVVANAYGIQYDMPALATPLQHGPSILAVAIAMGCILLSALFSVRVELRETPAQLLRPKAPKPGKRILLETLPFIWNHMNFSWKVTSRNIFRYKQRFLMTVVGIAGCTALIVTGFGIRDSLDAVPRKQFQEIWKYDLMVAFDQESLDIGEDGLKAMVEESGATDLCWWRQDAVTTVGERRLDAYLTIVEDAAAFQNIVTLRTYAQGEPLTLTDEGAIITYKVGKLLDLKVGDDITLTDTDNRVYTLPVLGITENYIDHYIFITTPYYESLYEHLPEYNLLAVRMEENTPEIRSSLGTQLMAADGVLTRVFTADTYDTVGDMFQQLDVVVVVLIVAAAALALVVLYNLNNINIEERVRELATIKVLGFTMPETASYVLRESACLTLIGILVGFLAGKVLHGFVMGTAEVDAIMFTRDIAAVSYLYAGLLTILFAALVSLAMMPKLRAINMVESLKSVE